MKIAVLCSACQTTEVLLSHLAEREGDTLRVFREPKLEATTILRHRIRRLGLLTTLGQLAFITVISHLLARAARERTKALLSVHRVCDAPKGIDIRDVPTVNDQVVADELAAFDPDIILVNGTRIIRRHILTSVAAPFVNIHVGITPQYRGVHGGYWALYSGDAGNFGSTIHIVDEGVDTGQVLAHVHTAPSLEDNFATYPLLQFLAAMPQLKVILDGLPGSVARVERGNSEVPSRQWYHPTLWQYVYGYLRGIS